MYGTWLSDFSGYFLDSCQQTDFQLVKTWVFATGILVSCSDYHIFYKMKMTRREVMNLYLSVIATVWRPASVRAVILRISHVPIFTDL